MSDHSHLDAQYFVDEHVYNCPFCNRRHVAYHIYDYVSFDWTEKKKCTCVFVACESCGRKSMHLSYSPPEFHHSIYNNNSRFRFKRDKTAPPAKTTRTESSP